MAGWLIIGIIDKLLLVLHLLLLCCIMYLFLRQAILEYFYISLFTDIFTDLLFVDQIIRLVCV